MKIIYKFFMFALILRMTPAILISMNIFPNTALKSLGYSYTDTTDVYSLILNLVSPSPISTGITIPIINYTISVQFSLTLLLGILTVVAFARDRTLPTIVGGISAMLFIPFVIDVGYTLVREAKNMYNSTPLVLMMVTIIVGFLAWGIITLLETAKGTGEQGVED